jgi:hypothetical protein
MYNIYIATHNPILRYYMSFMPDSSTHTPSYIKKAGLGMPNIHKVYIHRTINNTTTQAG